MYFQGKVAWITGASSGIGEELAKAMAKEGAHVIISSNEGEELERVRQETGDHERVKALWLDQADLESLEDKAAEALAWKGRVDLLFNNGGISQRSLVIDTGLDTFRRIMDIDFMAHVVITRALLPSMIERGTGHIVVTSSVAGKMGAPLRSGYSAAKHALHGFFDTLRAEVHDHGIRVTIVCPTAFQTGISRRSLKGDGSVYGKMSDHLAAGHTPAEAARSILEQVKKGRDEAVIGKDRLWLAVLIRRFFPRLFSKMLRKTKMN